MSGTNPIYTIGHSNFSVEYFIKMLKKHKIDCIVDVRSVPFSKHTPQFNQNDLKRALFAEGIKYVSMANEFGARRREKNLYHNDGYVDFDKTLNSELFKEGINRVSKGIQAGLNIALMCTEKNPLDCHRFSLVARGFSKFGYIVRHILGDGSIVSHKQMEENMLNIYFPNRKQGSLFDENKADTRQLIDEAYKLKNAEIGYRNDGESEIVNL